MLTQALTLLHSTLLYDFIYHGSLNGVFMVLFTLKKCMQFSIMHKMTMTIFYFMPSKRIYHTSIRVIPKEHLTQFFCEIMHLYKFLILDFFFVTYLKLNAYTRCQTFSCIVFTHLLFTIRLCAWMKYFDSVVIITGLAVIWFLHTTFA